MIKFIGSIINNFSDGITTVVVIQCKTESFWMLKGVHLEHLHITPSSRHHLAPTECSLAEKLTLQQLLPLERTKKAMRLPASVFLRSNDTPQPCAGQTSNKVLSHPNFGCNNSNKSNKPFWS